MKILTIVGARPQFIKAAAISRIITHQYQNIDEIIVHTGQHYDPNMSDIFFQELQIPKPKYNLEISGGAHGEMTGRMLEGVEKVLYQEKPDWVLVYGDTNSTLAAALAAAKLHIPVAHVEAGLRSFNMRMPEEINRILTDHVSTLLFCPTETAASNLQSEGVLKGVHNIGDVMYDVALFYKNQAIQRSEVMSKLGLEKAQFALATCHRAENTDDAKNMLEIFRALAEISKDISVVLPLHPRTRKLIDHYGYSKYLETFIVTEPLSFLDMVALEQSARVILTDSGGIQKESFFYRVPCITMREETEWVETVHLGFNKLVGANRDRIISAYQAIQSSKIDNEAYPYGDGHAADKVVSILLDS